MRRPDVFTLDYSHPLAQGLVFAGLGPGSAAGYPDSSLSRIPVTITNYNASSYWTYKDGRYWLKPGALATYPLAQVGAFGMLTAAPAWCVSCRIDATANSDAAYPAVICRPTGNADLLGFRRAIRSSCIRFGPTEIKSAAWGATEDLAFLGDNFWGWNRRVDAVDFYKNKALSTIATAASYGWGNVSRMFCSDATTTSFFDAFVADLLIHNRALSPAEIAILADRTDPMLGGLIVEERPVLWFDMGGSTDITGTVAATESGSDTAAITAQLLISGLVSASETGADTADVLGTLPVQGTMDATETGSDTASVSASLLVTGTVAAVEIGSDTAQIYGGSLSTITGTVAATESGPDTADVLGQLLISGLIDASEIGADTCAMLGTVTDTAPITADEVARTVRATPRMKTVTASARVKQVRYEVTRA